VFPELLNSKSIHEIREWPEASQFALSPNTIHYTPYKTSDETDNICLVYLHGNAEDVCSVERFKRCNAYKLVAFEYPGYGIRQGEALAFDLGDAHWVPLPPMHDARRQFACGTVDGCPIVAGGSGLKSAELYDVELNRWLRLPCDLPYVGELSGMGSARYVH
jgi:hypothetical protein